MIVPAVLLLCQTKQTISEEKELAKKIIAKVVKCGSFKLFKIGFL